MADKYTRVFILKMVYCSKCQGMLGASSPIICRDRAELLRRAERSHVDFFTATKTLCPVPALLTTFDEAFFLTTALEEMAKEQDGSGILGASELH